MDLWVVTDVAQCLDWVKDTMSIFMTAPVIYFTGMAVLGVAVSVARRFVPIKK